MPAQPWVGRPHLRRAQDAGIAQPEARLDRQRRFRLRRPAQLRRSASSSSWRARVIAASPHWTAVPPGFPSAPDCRCRKPGRRHRQARQGRGWTASRFQPRRRSFRSASSPSSLVSNSGSGGTIGLVAPSSVSSSLSSMKSSFPNSGGGRRLSLISVISCWMPGLGWKSGPTGAAAAAAAAAAVAVAAVAEAVAVAAAAVGRNCQPAGSR